MTKLFVGSKGTLGVITQAAVRLYARPAVCSVGICPFQTVDKALEAVVATLQCSVPIAKIGTIITCHIESFKSFKIISSTLVFYIIYLFVFSYYISFIFSGLIILNFISFEKG